MQHNMNEDQSQFTSEPYLTDESNQQRRGSQRKPNASASVYSAGKQFNVAPIYSNAQAKIIN